MGFVRMGMMCYLLEVGGSGGGEIFGIDLTIEVEERFYARPIAICQQPLRTAKEGIYAIGKRLCVNGREFHSQLWFTLKRSARDGANLRLAQLDHVGDKVLAHLHQLIGCLLLLQSVVASELLYRVFHLYQETHLMRHLRLLGRFQFTA